MGKSLILKFQKLNLKKEEKLRDKIGNLPKGNVQRRNLKNVIQGKEESGKGEERKRRNQKLVQISIQVYPSLFNAHINCEID